MDKAKQKLLEQTHQTILKVGFENNDYELVADLISTNFVGFGTALDEKIFGIKDLKALLKRQKEQSKGFEMKVALRTLHTHLSINENTAVYIDEGVLSITTGEEPIEMILRLSMVLEYIENKWLMVHFHSSKPEEVESEKDTWGVETWKERAEQLEREVAERTADLVLKNRDLEIEAALERVRARSMAMHSSDELNQVVAVLFENLKELQIPVTAAGIQVYLEDSEDMLNYVCGENSEGLVISHYRMPYFDNAIINDFKDARDKKDGFFVGNYSKKIKDSFYNYLFDNTEIKNVPEDIKQMIFDSPAYTISMAPVSNSLIAINDFKGNELSENHSVIIKRFAKVFEQAYIRFRDLQKAEAQAREGQIEAALERVRSASMAMHKTEDLADVVVVYFEQLNDLQIEFIQSWITIFHLDKGYVDVWFSPLNGIYDAPTHFKMPGALFEETSIKSWKEGLPFSYISFSSKEAVDQFFQICDDVTGGNYFRDIQKKLKLEHFEMLDANHKYGCISKSNTMKATDEEKDILQRFAKVFEQTYTRFLDLQKAEGQAREAQIEAALEKVRSRSMGMQKSTELLEVITVVSQQLQNLGFRFSHVSFINNSLKEHNSFWVAATGLPNPMRFIIPYKTMPIIDNLRKAQKNKDTFYKDVSSIKEHQQWFQHLLNHSGENVFPKEIVDYQMSKGLARSVSIHTNIMLALANTQSEPYSDYENKIIARFGQVFEQSYTRFLDLQRAEAQVKEAQIEAALERVRSRSMGMQKSEELEEIIQVVFDQFIQLGIAVDHSGFIMDYKSRDDMHIWLADQHKITSQITLPYFDSPHWNSYNEAKKKGDNLFLNRLNFKEKNKFYKEIFKYVPDLPEDAKTFYLQCPSLTIATTLADNIGLYIENYSGIQYSEDDQKTLIRFGRVFQQTYTRFLDLKKAEAQAREAQIEGALEKVRSRTMAMQASSELPLAANNLFLQVQELGIPAWSAGYCIWQDDKHHANCNMSSEGEIQKGFILPSIGEGYDFYTPQKKGERFHVKELGGEALVKHYEFMKQLPNMGEILKELIDAGLELPTFQIFHIVYFKFGYVMFITYEEVPEAHDIFKRFGQVFEQTYTRFLDLKQAENRARESQIQTALERVRSHSMGMQSTADFANVTTEMFNQLRSFGEDLFAAGIVFCDKHEGHVEQWHSIPGAGMLSPMIVPIDLDYIHQYRYDQWKAGTTLFSIEIPSDFIEQHFEDIFKLPSAQVTLKDLESRNAPMPAPPVWEIDYGASFKHGYILVSSLKPVENMDILPRFAQVFEQAYIRFLDLQKAEAQARESQIEAALEKVRSRTLAMQKSDELADTSVVVFKELLELGIEPNRLFIGIVKDNGDAIEAWATNEDGSKIEQHFKLYTSKNKSIKKMVAGWKQQKKSAIIDMQGKELQEYFHYLNKVMHIPFIDGLKQKRRVQSIAYFSGGLIGMAAPEEQPEETINLLERFAAVFNLTYTRFNDLKIAEAQAEQAEKDLINLQKAKKNAEKALAELQNTQKQLIQSEKMASLGELTAGIAHEIQNPLNFVNNFSEVSKELLDEMLEEIENGDMDEVRAIMRDVIQNLEKINHHGKRADGIVKGMLQHSRASGDKKEATDINALADEYLRLAYHGLRAKDKSFNAQLVTDFGEGIGKVAVIPQDIGRVVLNLLTNAFYAVHEKSKENIKDFEPTVSISTKKSKDMVILEVKDNGNGMPNSVKEKIFQPFFTTKPTGQGTGLGLSMSYDIVTKGHGGGLKVDTKEGKGTTFCILLPNNSKK